jgi:Cdc6-like AAA superfamily ATPase
MNDSFHEDLTLESLFEDVSKEKPKNPYEDFFLLSNPFPGVGQFFPNICVDQEEVKGEFARTLREFYLDEQSRRMTILGRTGAGKTNLLRFFEQRFKEWREPRQEKQAITDLFTIFIDKPQGGYFEVHQQIISQLGAMFFTEFFEAVQRGKVNMTKLPTELSGTSPELIRVLTHIADPPQRSLWSEPQLLQTLGNWLQGAKLSTDEKKQLGNVSVDVGKSSTVAIKFLSDFVKIFRRAELFKGLIIFLDEFEEIFSLGRSSTSQAQYAQDLRNMFDSLAQGVVFVIATAPLSDKLQQISPALSRRLGEGVELEPISDEDSACEYARAYINLGRQAFKEKTKRDITLPADVSDVDRSY